jgi:NAD(P)-binding Rossmann-like domain
MASITRKLLKTAVCLGSLLPVLQAKPILDERGFSAADTIIRDVCIIGGGSTGTYAAVRLRQDLGKSVVVVEKTNLLGGHTNTFVDPVTHFPVDYGVQAWHNISLVTQYFARLNVSLSAVSLVSPFTTEYIDLSTGKAVPNYAPPDPTAAVEAYAGLLLKYPYLSGELDLPNPVPADLLLPFGDFVTKYKLQALVPLAWTFALGVGDLLKSPTLYVMRNFGLPQLEDFLPGNLLTTTSHDNSLLYLQAAALLGSDVLYSSTMLRGERHTNGLHHITVNTPTGTKLIKAKKILFTAPPTLDNLSPFILDHHEKTVFEKWQYSTYYAGVIRNGIPDGVSVTNADPKAPYDIPAPPFIHDFSFAGVPGLHTFATVSTHPITQSEISETILCSLSSLASAGTFPASAASIEVINNHTPIQLRVDAKEIEKGFYTDLYALQGRHGTFYTGAAWGPDDSSLLWAYTEEKVFPALLAALA